MAKKTAKKAAKGKSKSSRSKKDATKKKVDKPKRRSKPVDEDDDDDEEASASSRRRSSSKRGGFYARTRKKLKRTQKRMRARSDFWKLEEGKNFFRPVLFQHNGQDELYVENARHWRIPTGGKDKAILRCKGDDCPICEILPDLPDELQDNFNGVGVSTSIMMNGIVRGKDQDKLVVAEFPVSVVVGKNGMEAFLDDEDPDFCDPFDPDKGRDFVITKDKSDKGKISYSVRLANKASALGMDVKPTDLNPLVSRFEDDAAYKKAVELLLDEEDERGRTARRKRKDDEDEPDDDYDEDDESDEEDDDDSEDDD